MGKNQALHDLKKNENEISLLNEKNELTKNLLLATDLDETVRLEIFIVFCMMLSSIINIYHSSSCLKFSTGFKTIFCTFYDILALHLQGVL